MVGHRRYLRRQRRHSKCISYTSKITKNILVCWNWLNMIFDNQTLYLIPFSLSFTLNSTNSKYAPFLPADESGLGSMNHYVRMLDKKFSLQPLLQALEKSEKVPGMHESSTSGLAQKLNVSKPIIVRNWFSICSNRNVFMILGSRCTERWRRGCFGSSIS